MRVACGDVYVGSWRRLIEVLIEAGRDPRRSRRPARAGRGAPRGAFFLRPGKKTRKEFHSTVRAPRSVEAITLRRESPPLIAPPIRGQAVR